MADGDTRSPHWATQKERGSFVLMKLTALAVRHLGRRPVTPVLYLIVLAAVMWWLMSHTPAGRYLYAIGGNPEAARLSGK